MHEPLSLEQFDQHRFISPLTYQSLLHSKECSSRNNSMVYDALAGNLVQSQNGVAMLLHHTAHSAT